MSTQAGPLTIYVGTYTQEHEDKHPTGASEGIYTLSFDAATGGLEVTGSDRVPTTPASSPSTPTGGGCTASTRSGTGPSIPAAQSARSTSTPKRAGSPC